ncbi:MAG: putative Tic20 family protein [Sphingobacteriales bacterium]|jgi:uncharacterized Tic20 family protein
MPSLKKIKEDLPHPSEIMLRDREDATGAYLLMFAAMGIGIPLPGINLVASFIYYLIYRSGSRFVAYHSHQAFITQIPLTMINAISVFWMIRVVFFFAPLSPPFITLIGMMVFLNIFFLTMSMVAASRARKGKFIFFPLCSKISLHRYYVRLKKLRESPLYR